MNVKLARNTAGTLLAAAILCLISTVVFAADPDFSGTWKGESGSPAAPAPAGAPGGRGAGGAPGGRGGGGFGGPQKIILRIKAKKDKASGNFSMGTSTDDVKDGKIDGNKLTFKTGLPETGFYEYEAVLNGDELTVTRSRAAGAAGAPAAPGGRGGFGGFGGGAQTFTLKRSK